MEKHPETIRNVTFHNSKNIGCANAPFMLTVVFANAKVGMY